MSYRLDDPDILIRGADGEDVIAILTPPHPSYPTISIAAYQDIFEGFENSENAVRKTPKDLACESHVTTKNCNILIFKAKH